MLLERFSKQLIHHLVNPRTFDVRLLIRMQKQVTFQERSVLLQIVVVPERSHGRYQP